MNDYTQRAKSPAQVLREGDLIATIFRNQHEKGVSYSTEIKRPYQDKEGNRKFTTKLRERDLVSAGELTRQSKDSIRDMKIEDRERQAHSPQTQRRSPFHNR